MQGVSMKNEPSERSKKVGRNFLWAALFLHTLHLLGMGILFCVIMPNIPVLPFPNIQVSPLTEKLLFLVALICVIGMFLALKFWYKPAAMKYAEEHGRSHGMNKWGEMLNNRPFIVVVGLAMFLGIVIGFWIF